MIMRLSVMMMIIVNIFNTSLLVIQPWKICVMWLQMKLIEDVSTILDILNIVSGVDLQFLFVCYLLCSIFIWIYYFIIIIIIIDVFICKYMLLQIYLKVLDRSKHILVITGDQDFRRVTTSLMAKDVTMMLGLTSNSVCSFFNKLK